MVTLLSKPVAPAEPEAGTSAAGMLAVSCGVGAILGWLGSRRRQASTAAAAAAAGASPLVAGATGLESSVTIAGGEEALFYVFILFAMLITLVLSVVLRETPRIGDSG